MQNTAVQSQHRFIGIKAKIYNIRLHPWIL